MQQDLIESHQVDLIIMDCTLEAMAISMVLESFGILVRRHFIGNVKKLIELLGRPDDLYTTVILCCHGSEQGMVLPELAGEIEQQMPYHHIITANNFAEFLKLNGKLIVTTGCCLGRTEFAYSFVEAGVTAYLGPHDYIDSNACIMFVINFLYHHLIKNLSAPHSFAVVADNFTDENLFTLITQ